MIQSWIIHDPTASMFATIAQDTSNEPFLASLKQHYRSTVISLSSGSPGDIEKAMMDEINDSIRLAETLPQSLIQ